MLSQEAKRILTNIQSESYTRGQVVELESLLTKLELLERISESYIRNEGVDGSKALAAKEQLRQFFGGLDS